MGQNNLLSMLIFALLILLSPFFYDIFSAIGRR
jgi:hypothetical protein